MVLIFTSQGVCCQKMPELGNQLLLKINDFRIERGVDSLLFTSYGNDVANDISNGVYDGESVNLDSLFQNKYNVGSLYLSCTTNRRSEIDGTIRTDENIINTVLNLWTTDEYIQYILFNHKFNDETSYCGGISTLLRDNKYHHTLIIHEEIKKR